MSAASMAGLSIAELARRLRAATSTADVDAIAADNGGAESAAIVDLGRALVAERERLAVSLHAREILLASVAHDLRNPLNTFAMSAGLLRDDLDGGAIDASRAMSLVTRMDRAVGRMQSLIEDLLEASRVDARRIDLAVRIEDAASLLVDAAKAASAAAGDRAPTVTADATDGTPKVRCDRARTIQLLVKVASYATKATGEGGSIRLACRANGATTSFVVHAFGPSGQPVRAPEEGRGGLALLIARGLTEAQSGAFTVDAGADLGVTVTLPSS
ncbi:MAG: HAMP domain-containing histidine kinase [Deltaproteobacteria bacterium]|nr:HAMP domain-containing histidine kinase [Deltaproteobacteria bacterium]